MTPKNLNSTIARAHNATQTLLALSATERRDILLQFSRALRTHSAAIIRANARDCRDARKNHIPDHFIERLTLNQNQCINIARGVHTIAMASDILFKNISVVKRPSGIVIAKQRVPLGLIAMIYESRPNVTVDAFTMAFKSGNAVILKGGKEIRHTNTIITRIIQDILVAHNIDCASITDLSGLDHESTVLLMQNSYIDCLIPRGGKKLINAVVQHATIPVIVTGASVVHTYIDTDANLDLAVNVVTNAKTRRVSICNALDVVLVHKDIIKLFAQKITPFLAEKNVAIRADAIAHSAFKKNNYPHLTRATAEDFDTEFLDYTLAIKTTENLHAAITHIQKHSLGHSEAIITTDTHKKDTFFRLIDAACLYHNTSTQFSDGGEFGLGGEIGISTQKLHARGPFAYESLTTYRYLVTSKGATRT